MKHFLLSAELLTLSTSGWNKWDWKRYDSNSQVQLLHSTEGRLRAELVHRTLETRTPNVCQNAACTSQHDTQMPFACSSPALQPVRGKSWLLLVQAHLCLTMLRRNRLTADWYTRGIHCPRGWLRIFRVITWMLSRSASCTKDFLSGKGRALHISVAGKCKPRHTQVAAIWT